MSLTTQAKLHRPRQRVFVFDSEALSKAVQGDREMTALIVHSDDQVIARDILKAAGLHGHTYAIDAILAAVAGREAVQGAQATVFTSDTDDNQLLAGHPVRVEKT